VLRHTREGESECTAWLGTLAGHCGNFGAKRLNALSCFFFFFPPPSSLRVGRDDEACWSVRRQARYVHMPMCAPTRSPLPD
jgi:hypothetical protein